MGREIPIIDVSPLLNGKGIGPEIAKQIHEACLEYGFFQAVNSGISATFQSEVLEVTTRFFDLPVEIKRKIEKPREGFRGYVKFSGEMTNGKADWREGIYHFPDFPGSGPAGRAEAEFSGTNPWPDEDLPEFRIKVTEFFEKATNLGYKMMEAIAIGLGQEPDFFTKKYTGVPFITTGLFHYPPHVPSSGEEGETFGVGVHTDYGNLVFVLQDDVGGLQIQTKEGDWIDVSPVPGALVVNVGDMLEGWTSGAYTATPHRVKTSSRDRVSAVLFFDPSLDCVISPIPLGETTIQSSEATSRASKFQFPLCFGDYVLKKFKKSFSIKSP